jgi:two-component system, OmpR family, sensor kinase
MRRRFTLAIVGVVAGTLLLVGFGTLALLTIQGRREAKRNVVALATHIATEEAAKTVPGIANLGRLLGQTKDLEIIRVDASGGTTGALPSGLTNSDLAPPALANMETVSGIEGNTAFAAVPFEFRSGGADILLAVVATQQAAGVGGVGLYLLLAGALILAIAFAVARTLARRISSPLVQIQTAAGQIAQGDLSARVPDLHVDAYPELRSLSASVNAMADNLERLRGQERQFLLSVSHDLRTPLTSIRGFAEALSDGTATDTRRAAGIIAAESRRLERLVRDLLDLAKLDARSFSLEVRPTDLSEVVDETARGFKPLAESLGLSIVIHPPAVDGPEGAPLVSADPDRLAQVCPTSSSGCGPAGAPRPDRSARGSGWPSSRSWSAPWGAPSGRSRPCPDGTTAAEPNRGPGRS